MCERIHSIQLGAKICDECRKQLGKLPKEYSSSSSSKEERVTIRGNELTLEEMKGTKVLTLGAGREVLPHNMAVTKM